MIALVLEVIFFSICSVSMFQVFNSESTNTGFAPICTIGLQEPIMVKEGMITSSPALIPTAIKARWIAFVPLEQLTPYLTPQYVLNLSSNSWIYFPAEEIQPELIASVTYSNSFPRKVGSQTGMNFFIVLPLIQSASLLLFP